MEAREYTPEEIERRLTYREGVLLGIVRPDNNYQIPNSIFGDTKPGEKLVGIMNGTLTFSEMDHYEHMLEEDQVFIPFGRRDTWHPETILRLIDEGQIGIVRNASAYSYCAPMDARQYLEEKSKSLHEDIRRRQHHLRSNAGENVFPCSKCGENLLPEGLIRHRCKEQSMVG